MATLPIWTLVLDIVLVLALLGYACAMYRAGIMASALSLIGLLGGGLLALWLLPGVVDRWLVDQGQAPRAVLLLLGVLAAAAVGLRLGALVGGWLRTVVSFRPARLLDSWLGAAAAVTVGATLLWAVAGTVQGALPGTAVRAVAGSRVLEGIDRVMPPAADRVLADAQQTLDSDGFPRVFSGLQREPIRAVAAPEPGPARGQGLDSAARSVVRVTGTAISCGRSQQGSGWVAAPERVVTNAHVLAGVSNPSVQIGGSGRRYPATTVAFDARRDVAVLAVPGLPSNPLPTGPRLSHGDSVIVAGFPLGGPYDLESGRVRDLMTARGHGIDGSSSVARDVYSIRAAVEQGNSGGPVLSPSGQVVGTVFAKSPTNASTGYALTLDETRPVVSEAVAATSAVSTGSCSR